MVSDDLQSLRPSRDDEFAQRVLKFINAADSGYADEVRAILQEDPELVDAQGQARYSTRNVRALHCALNYGHVDVIEALLAAGADINAKEGEEWAPIHYALRGAHPELAQMLLQRSVHVDVYAAAALGDIKKVQDYVDDQPDVVNQPGPGGATPLHFAKNAQVTSYLIDQGADVNAADQRGRTPLNWRSENGAVVNILLENGAQINDIFLACALGDVECVSRMLDADPALLHLHKDLRTGTPLHVAADKGHVDVARHLVERGAVVNAITDAGNITPMHEAAFSGRLEMVEYLLSQDANPAARDTEFNATPLAWARFNGQDQVVAMLGGE